MKNSSARHRRALISMVASVAAITAVCAGPGAPASAIRYDGPNNHHQFVRVTGAPGVLWSATMGLYRQDGTPIYTWDSGRKSGSGETWWFTKGDTDYITLRMNGSGPTWTHTDYDFRKLPQHDNNCFRISWASSSFAYQVAARFDDECTPY